MEYADSDGVRIAYERTGTPGGQTVVLVEGLGYGRWMWNWQREGLREYDLILPDNRGTGDSDVPDGPYTVPEMAGDIEAVLADAGVDRAHLVGASMGGMVAQQYALEFDRAASLCLLCTSPGGPEEEPIPESTLERMFGVPEEYDQREAIRYKMEPAMTDEFWAAEEGLIDEVVGWRLESDAPDRAREWQAAGVEAFDVSDRLADLEVPALVLHGERDRVVPVENGRLLAEGLPEATLETFDEGGSHLFFIERAGDVNARLRSFLP